MRNWIAKLGLFVVLLVAGHSVFANSVQYSTSNTYGSSVPTTPLTAPDSAFSFSFSATTPVILSASDFESFTTILPVSYSSGSFTGTVPGTAVIFFVGSSLGGFDLSFTLNGNSYLWEFFGSPQLFTGPTSNPVLLTGSFPYSTGVFSFNDDGGNFFSGPGTIAASTPTVVPEPGSLTLFGTGAVLLGGVIRRKLLSGIRA